MDFDIHDKSRTEFGIKFVQAPISKQRTDLGSLASELSVGRSLMNGFR